MSDDLRKAGVRGLATLGKIKEREIEDASDSNSSRLEIYVLVYYNCSIIDKRIYEI